MTNIRLGALVLLSISVMSCDVTLGLAGLYVGKSTTKGKYKDQRTPAGGGVTVTTESESNYTGDKSRLLIEAGPPGVIYVQLGGVGSEYASSLVITMAGAGPVFNQVGEATAEFKAETSRTAGGTEQTGTSKGTIVYKACSLNRRPSDVVLTCKYTNVNEYRSSSGTESSTGDGEGDVTFTGERVAGE